MADMKIFLIKRPDVADWDEYRSAIVVAEDVARARIIHPDGGSFWDFQKEEWVNYRESEFSWIANGTWVYPQNVIVEYISTFSAEAEIETNYRCGEVIISDYKAG